MKRAIFFKMLLCGIVQNVYQNQVQEQKKSKIRYQGFGLMFTKEFVFRKGARPVIYETKEEAKKRAPDELWRVVTLDLNKDEDFVDWKHKREWRIKGDFEFDLKDATILIPNHLAYKKFIVDLDKEILKELQGIIQMGHLSTFKNESKVIVSQFFPI